jgi:NAD(P)-dependent dehydrogenase (short-subunit alcohol dehydrogenase family)
MDLGVAGHGFLVVGGTAGMGLAAASALAADGAHVAVAGRDAERARAAADRLTTQHGVPVVALVGDVSRGGEADRLIAEARDALPDLAGVAVLTGLAGHVGLDAGDDAWDQAFQDVLMGTVRTVRAVVPHLVERGGGAVVTTAAHSVHSPSGARLPYGSLKAAVAVFTKGVARAYGAQGVRANCVAPGVVETDALTAIRGQVAEARGWPREGALERLMADEWGMDVALGRPGRPAEVGDVVAFLLSERAGYLSGALLNVDGGTDF